MTSCLMSSKAFRMLRVDLAEIDALSLAEGDPEGLEETFLGKSVAWSGAEVEISC